MEKSDRDISQWDARLKEQLERSFHNYHKKRIDLSVARDNKQIDWTGEILIVEKASSSSASATVRFNFDNADELILEEDVEIESIFGRLYLTNDAQADEWLDVIVGINFKYKKKIADLQFVAKADQQSYDFVKADFTTDYAYHDLDLSGIIPVGTVAVFLYGAYKSDSFDAEGSFATKGYTGIFLKSLHQSLR